MMAYGMHRESEIEMFESSNGNELTVICTVTVIVYRI